MGGGGGETSVILAYLKIYVYLFYHSHFLLDSALEMLNFKSILVTIYYHIRIWIHVTFKIYPCRSCPFKMYTSTSTQVQTDVTI